MGILKIKYQQFNVIAHPEIIIEGTDDGRNTWEPYHFRFKPGDVNDSPRFAAPLKPRVDWQLWFVALRDYHNTH